MSFAVDVNVLLYASDSASERHTRAIRFLRERARGGEVMCLAWPTILGYLRVATHPSIFDEPLTHTEAVSNVAALLALPHVRALSEEEGFWPVYRSVSSGVPIRGNLVPDAHLAAILRQHGVTVLYTVDRDFRKFDFLDVRDPFG